MEVFMAFLLVSLIHFLRRSQIICYLIDFSDFASASTLLLTFFHIHLLCNQAMVAFILVLLETK